MLAFIKYTDFLGQQETIRINGKRHFKSIYGGMLSIGIIILSMIMTIYLTVRNYKKYDPSITYSRQIMDRIENTMISKEGIDFFISLESPNNTYYLDDTIYTIKGAQMEVVFDHIDTGNIKSLEEKPFDFVICSELYKQEELSEYSINIPKDSFYCPPLNVHRLGGFWGGDFYNSIKIYINKCNNETALAKNPKRPCKPIEEINSYIDKGIVNIFITDYMLDQQNYTSPIKKYYKDVFDRISAKNTINYLISFRELSFLNDDGIIFNDYNPINFTTIHEIKNSYYFGESDLVVFFQLFTINYNDIYTRKYPKIQDLVTQIGGFIKALNLLGYLFYYLYIKPFQTIQQLTMGHLASLEYVINHKESLIAKKNVVRIRFENTNIKHNTERLFDDKSDNNSSSHYTYAQLKNGHEYNNKIKILNLENRNHSVFENEDLSFYKKNKVAPLTEKNSQKQTNQMNPLIDDKGENNAEGNNNNDFKLFKFSTFRKDFTKEKGINNIFDYKNTSNQNLKNNQRKKLKDKIKISNSSRIPIVNLNLANDNNYDEAKHDKMKESKVKKIKIEANTLMPINSLNNNYFPSKEQNIAKKNMNSKTIHELHLDKNKYVDKNIINFKLSKYLYCELFMAFWCSKNKPLKKIIHITEKMYNKLMSLETISMTTFDTKILKMLLLDDEYNKSINNIYNLLLIDNEEIYSIREHLFSFTKNSNKYSDKEIIDKINNFVL